MPQHAQLQYAQRGRTAPADHGAPVPLSRGVAIIVIAVISGGLWLGIIKLAGALF